MAKGVSKATSSKSALNQNNKRIYNFSAGPSMLPLDVLTIIQKELLNYQSTGMSVMEMSHRSKTFVEIAENTEEKLRKLMKLNKNQKVLFLQGGASQQFAMVPLNLLKSGEHADYVDTGSFASNAIKEARIIKKVNVIASSKEDGYTYIPKDIKTTKSAKYLHITTNNTVEGTRFTKLPKTEVPIVADMSSNILSEDIDFSKYGLIYAGAQKNLAPAGLAIVAIDSKLIDNANENLPQIFSYKAHIEKQSMFNTPPTFNIYILGLVLDWIKNQGGLKAVQKNNEAKAKILYDYLDSSKLFKTNVNKEDRSIMNVTFKTSDEELDGEFVKQAETEGLVTLKGHRSVGGMRASIYNAMPYEGVKKLVEFMDTFESKNKSKG
jgi:phosphoserine aminotransferase